MVIAPTVAPKMSRACRDLSGQDTARERDWKGKNSTQIKEGLHLASVGELSWRALSLFRRKLWLEKGGRYGAESVWEWGESDDRRPKLKLQMVWWQRKISDNAPLAALGQLAEPRRAFSLLFAPRWVPFGGLLGF